MLLEAQINGLNILPDTIEIVDEQTIPIEG